MPVVNKSIFVSAPMKKVFTVAVDPARWEQWYAGLSSPDRITGTGDPGSTIESHYAMAGTRLPITIEVQEVVSSPEKSVWKGTFSGGISGIQTFTYTPKDNGTQIDAEIEYAVPGKILGRIANAIFIEKIQENSTVQTLANLKALLEHE